MKQIRGKQEATMNHFVKLLEKNQTQIKTVLRKAKKSLEKAPQEGRIRIAHKKYGAPQFYLVTKKGDTNGRYLSKKDEPLLRQYCQRDYDRQVVARAEALLKAIDALIETGKTAPIGGIFAEDTARRAHIEPYVLTDEEFSQKWQAEPYESKGFAPDVPELYTERGERVRSKSEKIIADKLFALHIPYRYEAPLNLKERGGNTISVHPDFTILDVCERREIVLEHFGMMDNAEYAANAVRKLNLYAKNGYYVGSNLLVTMETAESPLDIRGFEKMLKVALDL